MSRRDTIIIAALVNAALLMILFATAVKSDDPSLKPHTKEAPALALKAQVREQTTRLPVAAAPSKDELLNQYLSSVPTLAEAESKEKILFSEEMQLTFAPSPKNTLPLEEPASSLNAHQQEYVNVTVKKGDFLEKIARANNTSVAAIMQANNIISTQLKVGQVLKIPLAEGSKPQKASAPVPTFSLPEDYYIVREGDNPWLIASRNKIKLEELLKLNGLDEQKAKRLRPGDKLRIR